MYLRECLIKNVGPIQHIDLSFELNSAGNPKPVLLVGKNGTGKTLVLAYIVDALSELAKRVFRDIVVDQQPGYSPFLKVTSGWDSRSNAVPHVCLLQFAADEQSLTYVEKVGSLDAKTLQTEMRGRFHGVQSWPTDDTNHKSVSGDKKVIETAFESGSICFFPSSRHERPHWLNARALEDTSAFGDYARFDGELQKPLVVERAAEDNRKWLLDVFLDSMVELGQIRSNNESSDGSPSADDALIHNKRLLTIGRQRVEKILRAVLEDDSAELVLRYRNAAFGRIGVRLGNGVAVPSLSHLSAGQALLFNLFATIVRYSDRNDISKSIQLETIEGLVIVDEIEAHLHADLQFEVLPRLLKLFPKVQFIVSTHSPLFSLGMERELGSDGIQIVEMPTGRSIGTERFAEFLSSFEIYRSTRLFENEIDAQVQRTSKPLILTEGQTDPVYIRTALELLGHSDLLSEVEIDQVGTSGRSGTAGGGDSHLKKAATFLEHNQQRFSRRVLLLYDNDTGRQPSSKEKLYERVVPKNEANRSVQSGIENLLPNDVFTETFYAVQEKRRADGGSTLIKSLKKEDLCRWICEERRDRNDFAAFETLLVPILREFARSPRSGAEIA